MKVVVAPRRFFSATYIRLVAKARRNLCWHTQGEGRRHEEEEEVRQFLRNENLLRDGWRLIERRERGVIYPEGSSLVSGAVVSCY